MEASSPSSRVRARAAAGTTPDRHPPRRADRRANRAGPLPSVLVPPLGTRTEVLPLLGADCRRAMDRKARHSATAAVNIPAAAAAAGHQGRALMSGVSLTTPIAASLYRWSAAYSPRARSRAAPNTPLMDNQPARAPKTAATPAMTTTPDSSQRRTFPAGVPKQVRMTTVSCCRPTKR